MASQMFNVGRELLQKRFDELAEEVFANSPILFDLDIELTLPMFDGGASLGEVKFRAHGPGEIRTFGDLARAIESGLLTEIVPPPPEPDSAVVEYERGRREEAWEDWLVLNGHTFADRESIPRQMFAQFLAARRLHPHDMEG